MMSHWLTNDKILEKGKTAEYYVSKKEIPLSRSLQNLIIKPTKRLVKLYALIKYIRGASMLKK